MDSRTGHGRGSDADSGDMSGVSRSNSSINDEDNGDEVEYDEMTPDQVVASTFSNEPVWRSATIVAPAPAPNAFQTFLESVPYGLAHLENPSDNRLGYDGMSDTSSENYSSNSSTSIDNIPQLVTPVARDSIPIPGIPVPLMRTHFEVRLGAEELVNHMAQLLNSTNGVCFQYNPFDLNWVIYYLSGPCHCKLRASIYQGFSERHLILELHRLMGDSSLFRSFYLLVKSDLVGSNPDQEIEDYDSFTVFTPLPSPPAIIAGSPDVFGLGPILRMARSPFAESQLEAARSLCELSADEDMCLNLAALGFVAILVELLLGSPSAWAKQHAMVALANISDHSVCGDYLLAVAVRPAMAILCTSDFELGELRVLAAYFLANLCSTRAVDVVQVADNSVLRSWVESVDNIDCERVRLHAERARSSLLPVFAR